MINSEGSNHQPRNCVAWKGDVYSQVLGNERTGYVRGLGLGPTPSALWGSRSSLGSIDEEDSSNEVDIMQSELLQMRQFMRKYAPNESMFQNINGTSSGQLPDADSSHGQIP
ncbi:hypothetical protein KY290_016723 [Solanum tuberosum]|uniref:Uncharacterized protein n=1 Tax=Solanum tuberosum TaxID=4113 RepID=A0ABQ7V996_SOLTU|nr:hypothetical protein KY284_016003 [Solanum tuberosum]KAH0760650.1 hypothetical protein KY290_016723 [Solanum tuberosum]